MKLSQFKIGERFKYGSKVWLCTDIVREHSTRTGIKSSVIIAACLTLCRTNDWARGLPQNIQNKAWKLPVAEVDPAWLTESLYHKLGENRFNSCKQKQCKIY